MEILKIKATALREPVAALMQIAQQGVFVLRDRPRIALRIPKPPVLEFTDGLVIARFERAKIEKPGKDFDLKRIEFSEDRIRIFSEWYFGVDTDILIELT